MAIESTLEILIKATDLSSGVLTGVGGRMSTLANGAKDVSQPFADLTTNLVKLDAALIAMVGGGLALAVAESGKFSGAFAEVTTLFETTPAQIDKFRADIVSYAQTSSSSLDDINAAIYAAISAGASYSESLGLVSQAEQTAIAGKASLGDATVLLVSSLNAYGAGMDQATKYSDALFTAVRDGQTTLPELSASLAQVTGLAATSGVSFDELLAAVAALTASGLPTSQAVTAIKGALTGILKPTKEAEETAQKLGIQFDSTALASKGLGGFMAELGDKAGGNIDVLSKLFGSVEGLNGVLILTGNGAVKFTSALDDMQNKAGATVTAYDKMADKLELTNQQLANNVKLTLVAVGDKILDDYTGLVDSLISVFQSIETAVKNGTFDGLFEVIESAFNKAQTSLENIAKNLPEALNGVDFNGFAESFGGMFDGVDLSTPEGLAAAIQLIVDTLETLVTFSRGVVEGLTPFVGMIAEAVEWFNGLDASTKSAVAGLTGFMTAVSLAAVPIAALGLAIQTVGTGLGALSGGGVAAGVTGLMTKLGPLLGTGGAVVAAGAAGYGIGTLINDQINNITQALSGEETLGGLVYEWVHGDGDKVDGAVDAVVSKVASIPVEASTSAEKFKAIEWDLDPQGNIPGTVGDATAAIATLATAADDQFESLKAYYISVGNSPEIAAAMASLETQTGRIPKAMEKAKDETKAQSDKLLTDLEQIASDERIKSLEFSFKLDEIALQGEVDMAIGMIENIGTVVTSTGDLIGDLTDQLNSNTGSSRRIIEEQIEADSKARALAMDDAHKAAEQQFEMTAARLERMKSGDPMISVTMDSSFEPEFRLIWQKILGNAKVEMSAEFSQFLVGI